jgi:hypothetical protein
MKTPNEKQTQHTPGPLAVKELGSFGKVNMAGQDGPVAFFGAQGRTQAENEANAAFAVRAWNSHDDLLAACERLVADTSNMTSWEFRKHRLDVIQNTRAAIAKAKGQP